MPSKNAEADFKHIIIIIIIIIIIEKLQSKQIQKY